MTALAGLPALPIAVCLVLSILACLFALPPLDEARGEASPLDGMPQDGDDGEEAWVTALMVV